MSEESKRSVTFAKAVALILSGSVSALAAPQPWRTGDEFQERLETKVSLVPQKNSLRGLISSLAESQQVAIFLDRRADPSVRTQFKPPEATLEQTLRHIAAVRKLGLAFFGPVVYIGPPDDVQRGATVAMIRQDEVAKLPPVARRRLQAKRPLHWEKLARPRQVLERLGREYGATFHGLDRVPHDLWPAADLPPLDFCEAAGLVLTGFGLCLDFRDESNVTIVELPPAPTAIRSYATRGSPAAFAAKLAEMLSESGAEFKAHRGRLYVKGRQEHHRAVESLLAGRQATVGRPTVKETSTYSLKVEKVPVYMILAAVRKKEQGLTFRVDKDAVEALKMPVSVKVVDASLEELLSAMLQPAALTFKRTGDEISILPAAKR